MAIRLVFLDRDGTINVDHGYVHDWSKWEFVPGAVEGLRRLLAAGFRLAVISNQSGVGRGMFPESAVRKLHARVDRELSALGVRISAFAFCPHGPDEDCECRKPRTGMARAIAAELGEPIDWAASWTVGDKPSDIEFGAAIGTRTVLLRSVYWVPDKLAVQPDLIASDWDAIARGICGG